MATAKARTRKKASSPAKKDNGLVPFHTANELRFDSFRVHVLRWCRGLCSVTVSVAATRLLP